MALTEKELDDLYIDMLIEMADGGIVQCHTLDILLQDPKVSRQSLEECTQVTFPFKDGIEEDFYEGTKEEELDVRQQAIKVIVKAYLDGFISSSRQNIVKEKKLFNAFRSLCEGNQNTKSIKQEVRNHIK